MNNKLRLLMLAALAVSSSVLATEYRTPYLSDRGPLRHSFKKLHKKKMNINTWSTVYTKEAHKAFLKHGTDTKELTALLFNNSDFAFREIFPGSNVPLNSPNFNPFMRTLSYSPRAKYFDWGANFGGQVDFPVWREDNGCVKGRIGLRANIPFRTIEVERGDITDKNADVLKDVVQSKVIRVSQNADGADNAGPVDRLVTAYRLDFVTSIANSQGQNIVNAPDATHVNFFGNNAVQAVADAGGAATNNEKREVVVGVVNAKEELNEPEFFAWQNLENGAAAAADGISKVHPDNIEPIGANGALADGKVGFFSDKVDYRGLINNPDSARLDEFAQAWLVFARAANSDDAVGKFGPNGAPGVGKTINDLIQDRIRAFRKNPFAFMAEEGFVFDDYKRSGLGDIDLDVFYEHAFSKHMLAELVLGVRFPTGAHKSSCNNPYRAIAKLGNGEHFEIKLGANFAWNACNWFSLKADLSYNFVLEDKEQRAAVFAGSTIKNIGPCTDADVDWGYFIGRLDFEFRHPKTCCLSTVFGYEFYYKTEDHLTFKKSTLQSWLKETVAPALDSKLARKNTESISHKARMESAWKPNKWLEIFWGGAVTFAGQNCFRDMDAHGGFNVRY